MPDLKPNIALVVLDTLRKDTFDRYFGGLNGISFDNAWSTTHYSSAAHASLFTGRFASEIGVHGKSPQVDCPEPLLSELLQEEGYTTNGFSTNTYASKYFGFDRGFDEFENETRVVGGNESSFNWPKFIKENKTKGARKYIDLLVSIQKSDAPFLFTLKQGAEIKLKDLGLLESDQSYVNGKKAIDYVEYREFESEGEFLFMNLMDVHGPYVAPSEYRTVEPVHPDGIRTMLADEIDFSPEVAKTAYTDCARYLSDIYQELHAKLTEDFDYVITISDHGEAFGEHGAWGHTGLGPEVTNIPLLIHAPPEDQRIELTEEPVNLHDLFQTVCDLADATPPQITRGETLRNASQFQDRYKLLESHGLSAEKQDGLLDEGYSPEDLEPLDQRLHAVASRNGYAFEKFDGTIETVGDPIPNVEEKIQSLVAELDQRDSASTTDIPEQVRSRLEDLGYT